MTAKATAARLAAWACVDNWPELNPDGVSIFKRKLTHADDVGMLMSDVPPGLGDMLAIEILPVRTTPTWLVHRMQEAEYTLTVQLAGLKLAVMEDAIEKLVRSFYQATDPATPAISYIRAATGYHPKTYDVSWQRASTGDTQRRTKCWIVTMNLGLTFQVDPFGAE